MAKKKRQQGVENRVARVKYQVLDTVEAGIELTGPEVKSLREGRGGLRDAFVKIQNGEAFAINIQIPPYQFADQRDYDPGRARRLLLHKDQVETLTRRTVTKGVTLVPLRIYLKNNFFKVSVGVVRGKKQYERREELKKRGIEREVQRELKNLG